MRSVVPKLIKNYCLRDPKRVAPQDSTEDQGASLVEYALLVALILLVCVVAIEAIGNKIPVKLSAVTSGMK